MPPPAELAQHFSKAFPSILPHSIVFLVCLWALEASPVSIRGEKKKLNISLVRQKKSINHFHVDYTELKESLEGKQEDFLSEIHN